MSDTIFIDTSAGTAVQQKDIPIAVLVPETSPILHEVMPEYDFDNQVAQVLAQPIKVKSGEIIRVQCTFDPTLRQLLPSLRNLPPRYVTWGEGSSDEMCLGVLSVATN